MPELAYLLPDELQAYLIAEGLFTSTSAPTLDDLEIFLYGLEAIFDAWVGHRIAPAPYTEEKTSNTNGIITLSKYPVIQVKQVQLRILAVEANNSILPPRYTKTEVLWTGGRTIQVFYPGDVYLVDYVAGSVEIPLQLKKCLFNLIKKMLQEKPGALDVNFLNAFCSTPNRDLISVHLPGGIGQTFRVGETTSKAGEGQGTNSQLDRMLAPLNGLRLRRQTIT
jgi:hypothetical protein